MKTGINAVENFLKGGGGGGGGDRVLGRYLNYFILGDGDTMVVRFLLDLDQLEIADFYEFVLDKNGKFQNFVVAPSYHADDPTWQGEDWVLKFGGKTTEYMTRELIEPQPRRRLVGIAVEREEYVTEVNGRNVTKTRDKIDRIEDRDGKKHDARNFLIVKQAKNFWNTITSYYHEFGTICDRDYKITRNGTGKDMVYTIIPKSPDPDWNSDGSSLKELQALYGYGTGMDANGNVISPDSEDRYLYITQTLSEWMENQASEERARAALVSSDGPADSAPAKDSWDSGSDEPNAAPSTVGAEMSSLRARLERHR